jgi:hypothetical protein
MKRYRTAWIYLWGAVLAAGTALSLPMLSVPALVIMFSVAVIVAISSLTLTRGRPTESASDLHAITRLILLRAAGGTVFVLSFIGLSVFLGALVWLLLFLAAASSPWLIGRGWRTLNRTPMEPEPARTPTNTTQATLPDPTVIRELSNKELCRAWRVSYLTMLGASSASDLQRLSTARGAYLNELERRNPVGFKAWIDSGARASGDPEKFLLNDFEDRHQHD